MLQSVQGEFEAAKAQMRPHFIARDPMLCGRVIVRGFFGVETHPSLKNVVESWGILQIGDLTFSSWCNY